MKCIFYSSLPAGTKVHTKDCMVVMLSKNKRWSDNTFSGVVVYGKEVGRFEKDWCADVFYSYEDYPCDDSVLEDK